MNAGTLTTHDYAVVALCLGLTTVADHYRFTLAVTARHRRRRAVGTPASWFGTTHSTGARGAQ